MTNYPAACTRRATPTPATDRPANRMSLAALLHVRADEVLGVGFQHIIDLVEDVVRFRRQLLAALLAGTARRVVVVPAALPGGLFLGHLRSPICPITKFGPFPPLPRSRPLRRGLTAPP